MVVNSNLIPIAQRATWADRCQLAKTGLPMDVAYIVNMTHRTLVREWIEGRKALEKK